MTVDMDQPRLGAAATSLEFDLERTSTLILVGWSNVLHLTLVARTVFPVHLLFITYLHLPCPKNGVGQTRRRKFGALMLRHSGPILSPRKMGRHTFQLAQFDE